MFKKLSILFLALGLTANCGSSRIVVGTGSDNVRNQTGSRPAATPKNINKDESLPTELSKIPTVTYCDLIRQSELYDRKLVRVRAVYYAAFEKMYLYDERCETGQPPAAPEKVPAETWVEWDKLFVTEGDSDEAKLNRQLDGFGRRDATLIGRFNSTRNGANAVNRFGHLTCCRYQFQILRVEKMTNLQDK